MILHIMAEHLMFLSLSLGYALCVIAKKQDGLLKTVGNTLGIGIIVISLTMGLLAAQYKSCMMGKICGMGKMGKVCPTMRTR